MKKSDVYKNRLAPIDGTQFAPKDLSVPTIATARDIGNIGAGFMAGKGIYFWFPTRLGFDAYNLKSNFKFKYDDYKVDIHIEMSEAPVSKEAQRIGFDIGEPQFLFKNTIMYKKIKEFDSKHLKLLE